MRLICLLLLPILFGRLQAQSLEEACASLSEHSCLERGEVAIAVVDLESGEQILGWNESGLMIPASTQKLVSTGAALGLLGPDYRFKTHFYAEGIISNEVLYGDLVIIPGADPTFLDAGDTEEELQKLVNKLAYALERLDILEIKGAVRVDASRFDRQAIPDGWVYQDLGNYYATGAYPLNSFGNTYAIQFRSGHRGSRPEITGLRPRLPMVIDNRLVAEGRGDHAYIYFSTDPELIFLKGSIPPGRGYFAIKGSLPNPPDYLAREIQQRLEQTGIDFEKEAGVDFDPRPENWPRRLILERRSLPLEEIVRDINFNSINMYAEALLLAIGLEKGGEGTYEQGLHWVEGYWRNRSDEVEDLRILDASGLSSSNRLTARFLTDVLYSMYHSEVSDAFIQSLPVAGLEGTVTFLLTPGTGDCIRAKSGSLTGHRAYAGYRMGDRPMAYAVIANDYTCPSWEVRGLMSDFLYALCDY